MRAQRTVVWGVGVWLACTLWPGRLPAEQRDPIFPLFSSWVRYDLGTNESSVAAGDFDGDGCDDLVVFDGQTHDVRILVDLGSGGQFEAGPPVPLDTSQNGLATGDFDGDGHVDLVSADPRVPGVSFWGGNGDGTLRPPLSLSLEQEPFALAAGDLDGDGQLDLVVGLSDNVLVATLLGNGDGTFHLRQLFGSDGNATSIALGDFNRDGVLDAAVTDASSDTVAILIGYGNGAFDAHALLAAPDGPQGVASGDLNGDGALDLAVIATASELLCVFFGRGDGSFAEASIYALGTSELWDVVIADLDGAGPLDVAASEHDNSFFVLLGDEGGALRALGPLIAGVQPWDLAAGDFDGDGSSDLALADHARAAVLYGLPAGGLPARAAVPSGYGYPGLAKFGDFNGDGRLDLAQAIRRADNDDLQVAFGNGDGTFHVSGFYDMGRDVQDFVVADFTNDGSPDIAAASLSERGVTLVAGQGDGSFGLAQDVLVEPQLVFAALAAGDLDGDGNLDLAVALRAGRVASLLGHGDGAFTERARPTLGSGLRAVTLGDLDGDGRLDLLATDDESPGLLFALLGQGDGTFADPVTYEVGGYPYAVAAHDLDADGLVDVALATGDSVLMLPGRGDGTFRDPVHVVDTCGAHRLVIGDLDLDLSPDIVVSQDCGPNFDFIVIPGAGPGGFGAPCNYAAGRGPDGLDLGDVDGDGDLDLVVALAGFFAYDNVVLNRARSVPPCRHHGDVTGNGRLSAADAQRAFAIVLGAYDPTPTEGCAADCTADGAVTAADAQRIFAAALGLASCVDPL